MAETGHRVERASDFAARGGECAPRRPGSARLAAYAGTARGLQLFPMSEVQENNKMHLVPRLFIGGYRELRRPENPVDQALMERLAEARQRLRLEGRDVKPLLGLRTFAAERGPRESPRPRHL